MLGLKFPKKNININDLVAFDSTVKPPSPSIGCRYLDELSPLQISRLYLVTLMNDETGIYVIKPEDKTRIIREVHSQDLILIKVERPKPQARAFIVP